MKKIIGTYVNFALSGKKEMEFADKIKAAYELEGYELLTETTIKDAGKTLGFHKKVTVEVK